MVPAMSEQLDDLYKEIILDHFRRPRRKGSLDAADARHARGFNPLCGDEVEVSVLVEDDNISDVRFEGRGCAISQASASIVSELAAGKTSDEFEDAFARFRSLLQITDAGESGAAHFDQDAPAGQQLGDAEALQSVRAFPSRIKCATLGWNTLEQALSGSGDFTER